MKTHDYQVIVIGAGPGGLTTAIGLGKANKRVLLIERKHWGGDCANFGCIPSKSLIASAHVAHNVRHANQWGINIANPCLGADRALDRVRTIVAHTVATHEPAALAKLGVGTLLGTATFQDPHTLVVKEPDGRERHLTAKHLVIATGSYPVLPQVSGLKEVPYFTNETIFQLPAIPQHLMILGAGPIGCELAQAFRRLGADVTLVQRNPRILVKEEWQAQEGMLTILRREGIQIRLASEAQGVVMKGKGVEMTIRCLATRQEETILGSHLLVAVGRLPSLADLNLDRAGIEHTPKGIRVDRYGRTSQSHIWAIGDVVGGPFFTHLAEHHARSLVHNLTARNKKPIDKIQPVPRCTFTDPEIASAGLLEHEATEDHGPNRIAIHYLPLDQVERAVTDGRQEGLIKVITKKSNDQILGFTIMAPRAAEMLGELYLAMIHHIPLHELRSMMHPFPTYGLGLRQVADI